MPITRKQQKFIDEYMADLNATQAAIRAGYSEDTAYSIGSRLLKDVEIKAEVQRRMKESRMTADELIKRFDAMSTGAVPTKVVKYANGKERVEYDTKGASDSLGKIHALFKDVSITEVDHLDIIDEEEE